MSDVMRKMLDELMGTNRDGNASNDGVDFTNSSVCRSFLLGLCPHDLFNNLGTFKGTRKIGICSKLHDSALKADYEKSSMTYDYGIDQLDHINDMIDECDHKVSRNKKRLMKVINDQRYGPESETVNVLQALSDQISIALKKAEELGALGHVEESLSTLQYVEELKADKRRAVENYRNNVTSSRNQQQKLRVCEVCAAYLSLYDDDRRLADHFRGRLHMGFVRLREVHEELREKVIEKRNQKDLIQTDREIRNCCGNHIESNTDYDYVKQSCLGYYDNSKKCSQNRPANDERYETKSPIRYRSRSPSSSDRDQEYESRSSDWSYNKYRVYYNTGREDKIHDHNTDGYNLHFDRKNVSDHSYREKLSPYQKRKKKRKKSRRKNKLKEF